MSPAQLLVGKEEGIAQRSQRPQRGDQDWPGEPKLVDTAAAGRELYESGESIAQRPQRPQRGE